MDRLTSLTVFARVVDSGGFSAAARRLNMSTTMVSNHVQSLEDRLGARLLNRTTRKVSLTEVGKAYYERCTQILAELEEADRAASAQQSTPRGTLCLYTGASLARFLAPVIGEFLPLYPEVSVELTIGERMVDLVDEGFDLAIRPVLPPDSSLIVRRLTPCSLLRARLSRAARGTAAGRRPRAAQLPALRLLSVRRRMALHRPGG
jgi:DNA-binding transcriptional LysR family regulator